MKQKTFYISLILLALITVGFITEMKLSQNLSEQQTKEAKHQAALDLKNTLESKNVTVTHELEYWYPVKLSAIQKDDYYFVRAVENLNASHVYWSRSGIAEEGDDYEFTVIIPGADWSLETAITYTTTDVTVWEWWHP